MYRKQKISILTGKKSNFYDTGLFNEDRKMAGSLGAMFVFVFIICVAIIALILALESHRKNNE